MLVISDMRWVVEFFFSPLFFFLLNSLYVLSHYMHSPSRTERLWFSHLLESQMLPSPTDKPLFQIDHEKQKRIHELLARSEVLDHFLQVKFPNLKRVGSCLSLNSMG